MKATGRNGFGLLTVSVGAIAASIATSGCADVPTEEDITVETSALNGDLVPSGGPLTRLTQNFLNPSEGSRESETNTYYGTVRTGVHGNDGGTITTTLQNLNQFRSLYEFAGNEVITRYYNRGDLGI
jgi:hypothetical protein